ncbi:MAG TPA: hypothetical protein VF281_01340 [Candidatus Saccharimonadales bacterium]
MPEIFNDTTEQTSISLEEVGEMSVLFERVVKKQMSSNLAEILLAKVQDELDGVQRSIQQFGQLNGMVYANVVEKLQLQETTLAERKESLQAAIESAKQLTIAMGHLATGKALLDSLDASMAPTLTIDSDTEDTLTVVGSFDIPLVPLQETKSIEVEIPEQIYAAEEAPKVEPTVRFERSLPSRIPPRGIRLTKSTPKPVSR